MEQGKIKFLYSLRSHGPMNMTGHMAFDRERLSRRASWLKIYDISSDMAVNPKVLHGARVEVVSKANETFGSLTCDGLITDKKGLALTMPFADCPPVALHDPVNEVIALLHCGWKPLAAGVIEACLTKMQKEFNVQPENLHAMIGPGICKIHYPVGIEVFKGLGLTYDSNKIYPGHVDISQEIKNRLTLNNVKAENIEDEERCTFDTEELYSFRKDKKSDPLDAGMAVLILK